MNNSFENMKNFDIKTVDIDSLEDISKIKINTNLPQKERMAEFIKQIKNPYCFRYKDTAVKITFNDNGPSFEECVKNFLKAKNML